MDESNALIGLTYISLLMLLGPPLMVLLQEFHEEINGHSHFDFEDEDYPIEALFPPTPKHAA